jgi:hypothetical protein
MAKAGVFPAMRRGEVVEIAEGEVGTRFSRDEVEVNFVEWAHSPVGDDVGFVKMTLLFILSKDFDRRYALIRSGACTWSAVSQVLSLSGYPFHFRRYCNVLFFPWYRWLTIRSTSYSSTSSIRSGGGRKKFGP